MVVFSEKMPEYMVFFAEINLNQRTLKYPSYKVSTVLS